MPVRPLTERERREMRGEEAPAATLDRLRVLIVYPDLGTSRPAVGSEARLGVKIVDVESSDAPQFRGHGLTDPEQLEMFVTDPAGRARGLEPQRVGKGNYNAVFTATVPGLHSWSLRADGNSASIRFQVAEVS